MSSTSGVPPNPAFTPEEIALVEAAIKDPTRITKKVAEISGRIFKALDEKTAGGQTEKLKSLVKGIEKMALEGLDWSFFREVCSAFRNIATRQGNSVQILYSELGEKGARAIFEDLKSDSLFLKEEARELSRGFGKGEKIKNAEVEKARKDAFSDDDSIDKKRKALLDVTNKFLDKVRSIFPEGCFKSIGSIVPVSHYSPLTKPIDPHPLTNEQKIRYIEICMEEVKNKAPGVAKKKEFELNQLELAKKGENFHKYVKDVGSITCWLSPDNKEKLQKRLRDEFIGDTEARIEEDTVVKLAKEIHQNLMDLSGVLSGLRESLSTLLKGMRERD